MLLGEVCKGDGWGGDCVEVLIGVDCVVEVYLVIWEDCEVGFVEVDVVGDEDDKVFGFWCFNEGYSCYFVFGYFELLVLKMWDDDLEFCLRGCGIWYVFND